MDSQHKNRMCIVAYSLYRSILSHSLKVRNSIELLVLYHNCAVFLSTPKEWSDFCYTMLVEMLDPESRSLCACADRPIVLGIGNGPVVMTSSPCLRRRSGAAQGDIIILYYNYYEYTYVHVTSYVCFTLQVIFTSLFQPSPVESLPCWSDATILTLVC